jgi:hypothetical protein
LRNVSGGARVSSGNTSNNGVSNTSNNGNDYSAGSYSGSGYGNSDRYGYYGAAAGAAYGAAAGYAYGSQSSGSSDQTYTYLDQSSCYRTVSYETRRGWHKRVVNVCE